MVVVSSGFCNVFYSGKTTKISTRAVRGSTEIKVSLSLGTLLLLSSTENKRVYSIRGKCDPEERTCPLQKRSIESEIKHVNLDTQTELKKAFSLPAIVEFT